MHRGMPRMSTLQQLEGSLLQKLEPVAPTGSMQLFCAPQVPVESLGGLQISPGRCAPLPRLHAPTGEPAAFSQVVLPLLAAPQQSEVWLQVSPVGRQPEGTWQMVVPAAAKGPQALLQQNLSQVPPGVPWQRMPAGAHPPVPLPAEAVHTPTVLPAAMVQKPGQH